MNPSLISSPPDPTEALALERLLNQSINPGNVADQNLWGRVAHL
jgi:hypothetical protein